jgi:hypothetical protein
MSSLHFHLAGKRPFNEVLQLPATTNAAVFKPDTGAPDVWSNAFDAQKANLWENGMPFEEIQYASAGKNTQPENGSADTYPVFDVAIVNISPGGYCLSWAKEVPSQLQAGELLGEGHRGLP